VKVIMKVHAILLSFAVSFALSAQAAMSTTASPSADTKKTPDPATEISKASPSALSATGSSIARHLFPVKDDKGLLLTCIAPEMETNSETDVFNNCTLAPGRTLDDVMHSFIRAIHQEQREQLKDQAGWHQNSEENAEQKNAQK
jgi:hypothetical protein